MSDFFIIPNWSIPLNIKAIQTTRKNGFSCKHFDSFNLSENVGDEIAVVNKNIKKLMQYLPERPKWLHQIHSNLSIQIPSNSINADGAFTREKKIICAVRTADCLPILVTDEEGSCVAAIHAGWRGLGSGIIENFFQKIKLKGPAIVWLGPCISQDVFEVGLDVYDFFIKHDSRMAPVFNYKRKNKFYLNLTRAAIIKLRNIGVKNISAIEDICTYRDSEQFYSYRRDKITGRMASLIWIDD